MINTILVPLDASPFGEQALPVASGIAGHGPPDPTPRLHLVQVHVPVYRAVMGDAHFLSYRPTPGRAACRRFRLPMRYLWGPALPLS